MVIHSVGLFFGFELLFAMAAIAGVVILILWAVRPHAFAPSSSLPMAPPSGQMGTHEMPLDILARRFASGEITAEEYERGRDLLGGGKT